MAEQAASSNALRSGLDVTAPKFLANTAAVKALLAEIAEQEAVIREGGGAKAAEAQRAKGRLTARESPALRDFLRLLRKSKDRIRRGKDG